MGPAVSGGTFQDALARGVKVGVIASSDKKHHFGGPWGAGLAGLWADELTPEAIWRAFFARRTYGVTGDRIELQFTADGSPMGSEVSAERAVRFDVAVRAVDAVDRIELLRDGRVIDTHAHADTWPAGAGGTAVRLKARFEFGWGPSPVRGLPPMARRWDATISPRGGKILGAHGCFTLAGQRIDPPGAAGCALHLVTPTDGMGVPLAKLATPFTPAGGVTGNQSVVIEAELEPTGGLQLRAGELSADLSVEELLSGSRVFAMTDEARALIKRTFEYEPDDLQSPDPIYFNAWKIKVHQAWPIEAWRVQCAFEDEPPPGTNAYYVRVSQLNGQRAWSSPIWVTRGAGSAEESK